MKVNKHKLRELQFSNFSLYGYSVAGEESVFIAPEFDVAFDIGKCPFEALRINNVLLTHGHMDHAAGLPYYFAEHYFQSKKIGTALVPFEITEDLDDLMKCWNKIDGCIPPYKIVGMRHGDDFVINRQFIVRAFSTNHVIPSIGFSLIEVRHKLKSEFKKTSQSGLIELKKQGVELTRIEEIPIVAYLGDTAVADYASLPYVANAKVLLIECTFFRQEQIERTHEFKHMHVSDLPIVLKNMNNEHIIITHVTKSISINDAKIILQKHISGDILQRISFFMH